MFEDDSRPGDEHSVGVGDSGFTGLEALLTEDDSPAKVKVFGVGGCGGNTIGMLLERLNSDLLAKIEVYLANTDVQDLRKIRHQLLPPEHKLQLGKTHTEGKGAGGDPKRGHDSALESLDDFKALCSDADLVILVGGLGGGTGTGAIPVFAQELKSQKKLVLAVVTMPFGFEGKKRRERSRQAVSELLGTKNNPMTADTVVHLENQRLLGEDMGEMTYNDAMHTCSEVLADIIRGLISVICRPSKQNADFADVKAVLENGGQAIIGMGVGRGDNRCKEAAHNAIAMPLSDKPVVSGIGKILYVIRGSAALKMGEIETVSEELRRHTRDNADIIWAHDQDPDMPDDEIEVFVMASEIQHPEPMDEPPSLAKGVKTSPESQQIPAPPQPVEATPAPEEHLVAQEGVQGDNVVSFEELRSKKEAAGRHHLPRHPQHRLQQETGYLGRQQVSQPPVLSPHPRRPAAPSHISAYDPTGEGSAEQSGKRRDEQAGILQSHRPRAEGFPSSGFPSSAFPSTETEASFRSSGSPSFRVDPTESSSKEEGFQQWGLETPRPLVESSHWQFDTSNADHDMDPDDV